MDHKQINLLKQAAVSASNKANKSGNTMDHADAIRANMDWLAMQIQYDQTRLRNLEKELDLLLSDDLKQAKKGAIPVVRKKPIVDNRKDAKKPNPRTTTVIKKSAPKRK